jgi:hypothetical protein
VGSAGSMAPIQDRPALALINPFRRAIYHKASNADRIGRYQWTTACVGRGTPIEGRDIAQALSALPEGNRRSL